MRSSHHATGLHEASNLRSSRAAFIEVRGAADYRKREAEIAALPDATFKGRALKVLRCHGVRGKGPHDCNVPESMLWALIDLRYWCCVFHHGDQELAFPRRAGTVQELSKAVVSPSVGDTPPTDRS